MSLFRRFRPWLVQNDLRRPGRFEGWYFKLTTADGRSLAFIPGLSTAPADPHAFVQVIDGHTGRTAYARFAAEAFSWTDEPFEVRVGPNRFGPEGMTLTLEGPSATASGRLRFGAWCPYPSGFLRAGVMGPFGIPGFLECYHGIVSADHALEGRLELRLGGDPSETWDFTGGRGYIEKDWGTSFPADYVWLQANQYAQEGLSVFASLAAIPFRGLDFPGLIAFVRRPDQGFLTLATWNGARVTGLRVTDTEYEVRLRRGAYTLELQGRQHRAGRLQAPVAGQMDRVIKESVDGRLAFTLREGAALRAEGESAGAGLEQGGDPSRLAAWFLTGRRPRG